MVSSDGTKGRKQLNERASIKRFIFHFLDFFSLMKNNFQVNAGSKMLNLTPMKTPMQQTKSQKPDVAI